MVAVEARRNTFIFSHRDFGMDWILSCKPRKAVRFPLRIHKSKFTKTKMVRQLRSAMRRRHGMYISDIFKNFAKFFLLFTHYFLLSEFPLSVSFGVAWSLPLPIGSYALALALWSWLSVLALCLLLSVCLQVPVLPSGSTLVLVPWFPWLVKWCSIIPARMFMCFWLASC